MSVVLSLDVGRLARLKALRSRLATLMQRGDHAGASLCADLILDLIGLRQFKLENHS